MIALKITHALLVILRAILELDREAYGLEICKRADVPRGVGYNILARLLGTGVLTARWEDTEPDGRPLRKYYTLVPERRAEVVDLLVKRGVPLPEVSA